MLHFASGLQYELCVFYWFLWKKANQKKINIIIIYSWHWNVNKHLIELCCKKV